MIGTIGKWGKRETDMPQPLSWASEQRVYNWKPGYTRETAPNDHGLEAELFSEENRINSGINFKNYANLKGKVLGGPERLAPMESFEDIDLEPAVLANIKRMKYTEPTPIQKSAIPILLKNYDLMACAQTGSGKTAAFLVPIISNLTKKILCGKLHMIRRQPGHGHGKACPILMVILPTRELAIQIFEEARRFAYMTPLRPAVIYGGANINVQRAQVTQGCDILIATPGRLRDMIERGTVSLTHVRHVVLDEADRMLDMGFEPQIRSIMKHSSLPRDEGLQTLMFSATFPKMIQVLARDFLHENYCRLRIGRIGGTTDDITQSILHVNEMDKREALVRILLTHPPSRTMIFVETKRTADNLDDFLYNKLFPTCSIHGDRTQSEREHSLEAFKSGRSPILIATSVASRGLDIKDVMHVINYDLCVDIDEYVHRIGRTGRAGNPGYATSFYNDKSVAMAPQLAKLLAECKQEVPDFLAGYIDSNTTYEAEDFLGDDDEAEPVGASAASGTRAPLGAWVDQATGNDPIQAAAWDAHATNSPPAQAASWDSPAWASTGTSATRDAEMGGWNGRNEATTRGDGWGSSEIKEVSTKN